MSYMTERFDPAKAVNDIVDWIKHYFAENGPTAKAVIGISGGKDSSIAATLLTRALGEDRVLGVLMPCGGQKDIMDSMRLIEHLGIPFMEVDIGTTMDALTEAMPEDLFGERNDIYYTNTPARLRMTTLYAIAGLVGGRVANTCNFSEDYLGYSTKYGDNAGDFAVLANYTVEEVIAIGEYLELPNRLVYKIPDDGMSGKSDEEKLGLTYKDLDSYICDGIVPSAETLAKIARLYKMSRHKEKHMPMAPNPFYRFRKNNRLSSAASLEEGDFFF